MVVQLRVVGAAHRGKPAPWIVLVALLLCAQSLRAQTFHGTVRDSASQQPIAGAVMMFLDSSHTVLARRITDEHGQFAAAVNGAPRFARVVRIGFLPREIGLPSAAGAPVTIDLAMLRVPTMLGTVDIREQSRCGKRSDRAAALGLWEQARAGLLATVVARETNTASIHRLTFERTFDGASDKITRFVVSADSATGAGKSFNASRSAKDFIANGFASDSGDDRILYGPDADVLLDDAFAAGYCFRLAAKVKSRQTEVGLAFSAADDHRSHGRVDIDGTLWVDTAARAIRDIEYQYVGLPRALDEYHPGGLISFRQMSNGVVMIDRWYIRNVGGLQDTVAGSTGAHERVWFFASENGGDLARAEWPDGQMWRAPLGSLRIRATTAAGAPAVGALIGLPGTPYSGMADANGEIRIAELEPGPYAVNVMTPPLADIGLGIPTGLKFVAVRDSTYQATLKVPTPAAWVADRCVADRQWDVRDSVFVVGRVVNSRGTPVAGVTVRFFVQASAGQWSLLSDFYTTGADGVFQSCNYAYVPGDAIRVQASMPGQKPFMTPVPLTGKLSTILVHLPPAP